MQIKVPDLVKTKNKKTENHVNSNNHRPVIIIDQRAISEFKTRYGLCLPSILSTGLQNKKLVINGTQVM